MTAGKKYIKTEFTVHDRFLEEFGAIYIQRRRAKRRDVNEVWICCAIKYYIGVQCDLWG